MVYLLHFEPAFRHARHFMGVVTTYRELVDLLEAPAERAKSPLLRAAAGAGVQFVVANTWSVNQTHALELTRRHDKPNLCPICNPSRGLHVV